MRLLTRDRVGRLALCAMLLVAILASGLVWANTRWGIGLRGDSFMYVSGARSLALGLGYSRISGGGEVKPITHFPPLYSVVLAAFQAAGWDAVPAARVLAIALMGVNTLLAGILARRVANRAFAGVVGAGLFGLNPLFLDVHSWAMAEALFISLVFGLLLVLPWAADGRERRATVPGLLAGLAFLTRYVGAAGIAAGGATLLWTGRGGRVRPRRFFLFMLASLLLTGVWLVRNLLISGSTTNRQIQWHVVDTWKKASEAGTTFAEWLLPNGMVAVYGSLVWVGLAVAIAVVGLAVVMLLRRADSGASALADGTARALAWFMVAYAAVLAGNLLLLDSSTPLDARILSPLLAALVPLLAGWISRAWQGHWASRLLAVLVVLALLAGFIEDGRRMLDQGWLRGWGFSHRLWRTSALMQAIRDLPPLTLYTNEPDLVYFQTGRPSYIVFGATDPVTGKPRQGYADWLAQAREALGQGRGALIFVNYEQLLGSPEDRAMVEALSAGLATIGRYDDGVILSAGSLR